MLKSLNETEIEKEEETSTLFRAASLTTTLMDLYMKSVCTGFLHSAIQDTILKLLESKQSCEVNCLYIHVIVLRLYQTIRIIAYTF